MFKKNFKKVDQAEKVFSCLHSEAYQSVRIIADRTGMSASNVLNRLRGLGDKVEKKEFCPGQPRKGHLWRKKQEPKSLK